MGTHPIFESDFDCLTETFWMTGIKIIFLYVGVLVYGQLQISDEDIAEPPPNSKNETIVHSKIIPGNSAAAIIHYAQLNSEFCGLAHCHECLRLLKVKGKELGSNALKNRVYWTCTVVWLWEQCCPRWSGALVQML